MRRSSVRAIYLWTGALGFIATALVGLASIPWPWYVDFRAGKSEIRVALLRYSVQLTRFPGVDLHESRLRWQTGFPNPMWEGSYWRPRCGRFPLSVSHGYVY